MPHEEDDDNPLGDRGLAIALAIVVSAMILGGIIAVLWGRATWMDAVDDAERAREQAQERINAEARSHAEPD